MRDTFHSGQILEIAIGERADNKLYRAQVNGTDSRNLVLYVPGFDPMRFVDLLKGTPVTLRVEWEGEPHLGSSRLAEHFKNSSPSLVIRRPSELFSVERRANAVVPGEVEVRYTVRAGGPIREAASAGANGAGSISLRMVPEPFDPGTGLTVEMVDSSGESLIVTGSVRSAKRERVDGLRYAVVLSLDPLDTRRREQLLDILLHTGPGGGSGSNR